ncbi:glycosylphosphatidylinositol anchor attachment 1 [Lycorma delicatula]|uniref:glycosylphosphatidylinositol anchor attachment 1 n=1 Tax=Lycorma delicatula TaxID=130591 RepID=UPI003F517D37
MNKNFMGLLTDPGTSHSHLRRLLLRYHSKVCVILYFGAVVWFLLLAHHHFNNGTYFSENALLPGLVKGEYDMDNEARSLLAELESEAAHHSNSLPSAWLLSRFRRLSLDAYTHNFTLNYPFGPGSKFTGRNVYGILRAARSSSMEAVVLSVPYRPPSSVHPTTAPGLALMLSLAKFFRRQKYWAKDIIFLVTEHEQLGAQAWLEAYHGASCGLPGVLEHGDIGGRGGAIQAAINLEIHASKVGYIDVKLAGLNGQLPNLDLVNLVHRMCSKEGVRHTFNNKEKVYEHNSWWSSWVKGIHTLMSMVITQATGMPNGNHGLFHRFGIEAVTLEGFEKVGRGSPATFYQVGRVLEGLFRSLNNLLERFHQSFFFYLLPDTDRYISIGLYMPCLVMLAGALIIKAFTLWIKVQHNLPLTGDALSTVSSPSVSTSDPANDGEQQVIQPLPKSAMNVVMIGTVVFVNHLFSVILFSSMQGFTRLTTSLSSEDALYLAFFIGSLITIFSPYFIKLLKPDNFEHQWVLLNIIALLELATVLLAVGMNNFSLAFLVATIYVPPALWLQPTSNRLCKKMCWVLLHPFFMLCWVVTGFTIAMFPELTFHQIVSRSFSANKQALVLCAVDSYIYASWGFSVATIFFLPTWTLFWQLMLTSRPRQDVESRKKCN